MYIKLFFNDKPLFLCDRIDEDIEPYTRHENVPMMQELNSHAVKTMIQEMQQPNIHAGVFVHPDLEELRSEFFKEFKIVQAGGGLVQNPKQEYLLIFRRGKWDLPKGKLDDGETIEQCALREVEEETGILDITLHEPLMITWHTYHHWTDFALKESHWYAMSIAREQQLIPQVEEDIVEARWVALKDIPKYLDNNTFPSVVDVLKKGIAAKQP